MRSVLPAALLIIVVMVAPSSGAFAQPGALRAGAARVDITPAEDALPENYLGILDRIHARAIVLDNGDATAALISVDAGAVPDAIWLDVTAALEDELGIPRDNVLITATHTHSVPRQVPDGYADRIVESVRLARARLVPARIGFGTGVSHINVNRNIIDPDTRRWWEGANYDGPSDKTVAVIELETLDGKPIAVYYN
jgi:neutral ceramidase